MTSKIENLIYYYCYQNDLSTNDPYDIWETTLGKVVKKKYYISPKLWLPVVGSLTIWDLFINKHFPYKHTKKEYPIVRALSALSLINQYKIAPNVTTHDFIQKHINWLLNHATKTKHGIGWGLPFEWRASQEIVYSPNTPFSTHTPYAFEAIFEFNKISYSENCVDALDQIFNFFDKDIRIMYQDDDKMAISYGPFKDRIAINSVSYALLIYSYCTEIFPHKNGYLKSKIRKLYNYIKFHQGHKGEWYYSPDKNSSFIDCFHSCFIVQNLIKSKERLPDIIEEDIITKGWDFIKNNFKNPKMNLYKRFAIRNKPGIIEYDLYDNAEVLHTAILLDDTEIQKMLVDSILKNFISKDKIYSAILMGGIKTNKDMLRWAIIPLIYALSLYQLKENVRNSRSS